VRRLGPVSALGLLVLGRVLLEVTVLVFVAITIAARGVDYGAAVRMVATDPLPLGAAQLAALGAVIALGVWLSAPGEAPGPTLGLMPARTGIVVAAAIAGLGLQLPMVELTTLVARAVPRMAHSPEVDALITQLTRIDSPMRAITVPFTFVFIAPVTEELLFRGLIQRSMRERYGPRAAIASSALLFGAFHFDLQALFFATVVGLVLGLLAERTQSTMPGIALHAGFNAVPVLVPEALLRIPGFNTGMQEDVPWPFVVGSGVVALIALSSVAWMISTQKPPSPSP
jgi:membrane protease YdiL (CAAX protease family)